MPERNKHDLRIERGQRTRERLIEEGLRLFAVKGFDSVSTRELAVASEANVAAIHFHFGGKAGLYEAVINHVTEHLSGIYADAIRPAAELSAKASPEEAAQAVRDMIQTLIGALLLSNRSRWMSLLLQREFITPTEAFTRIFETALFPVLDAFSGAIQVATGTPRQSLNNKTLAFGLFVMVSAFSRSRTTFLKWAGRQEYTRQDIREVSHVVSNFALSGLLGTGLN